MANANLTITALNRFTISKQMYTKFKRGMIKRISSRTFEKLLAVNLGESAIESIIDGITDSMEQTNEFIDIGWMTT